MISRIKIISGLFLIIICIALSAFRVYANEEISETQYESESGASIISEEIEESAGEISSESIEDASEEMPNDDIEEESESSTDNPVEYQTDGECEQAETEHLHNCIKVEAKEPTCTLAGNVEYWKCEECGLFFADEAAAVVITSEDIIVAEKGHNWDTGIVTKEATCQSNGEKTFTCTDCGKKRVETTERKAHIINNNMCVLCGGREGVAKGNDGNWYYIVGGKVETQYTGIKPNSYGWWRIVNGKVDFSCDSVVQNENGWWYCKGGKVQFDYTGIKPNEYGWWRIVNGKVDFSCDSVVQNENGWWYCKGGKVQFDYTGIKPNEYGWWRIVNGKVNFSCNSVEQNENGWWYCKGGKVQFGYFGLAENRYGWWYVKGGKVDFSYNEPASNRSGTWLITNGKVVFGRNGVVKGGDGNWYYVKNSKVIPVTGFFSNQYGTWYVVGGKVNFSYTGMASSGTTRAFVVNGKVNTLNITGNNQNIVIFGDSVAEGMGMWDNLQLRHTTIMAESLNLNEFNFSKSGAGYLYESRGDALPTYSDELERIALSYMTQDQINNTRIVFIEGGINDYFMYNKWNSRSDANEYYINSIIDFINKVKNTFPNAKVYFAYGERSSLSWLENNWLWNQDYLEMISNVYQKVADIPNLYIIDGENNDAYYYYNILDQDDKYYLDGVHPNKTGHRIMANKLLTAVEK